MKHIRRILITRPEGSFRKLEDWCRKKNIDLICQSYIQTISRDEQTLPQTDWIFFSSPNCVKHFMTHYKTDKEKIAAIGKGTSSILRGYCVTPEFIGDENASPTAIGMRFKQVLQENETVLFPISQRSKKTIINTLPKKQVRPVIIYDTIFSNSESIQEIIDLALFTSPSNFEGYLKHHHNRSDEIWVAFGDTTAEAILTKYPDRAVHVLKGSNENAFISFLEENVSS